MIRILIIDDQNSVLQNLEGLIELEEELKVVGTANNGEAGIELVEKLQPDVAIIDLNMPLKNGIETTHIITQNHPQTKVLIFTSSDGRMLNQAILAGAKGYLAKNSSREDLIAAIYAIKRNNVYIGKGILDRVQFSSVNRQTSQLKQINLWLAKEVINCWCEHSFSPTLNIKQIIESLDLDRAGLSRMKEYLCRSENTDITLTEEIRLKVESFFNDIEDANNPEQNLVDKKTQIVHWLDNKDNTEYSATIHNNSQLLQTVTIEKLENIIATLWQQTAPLPLLNILQSLEDYLSNWHSFFEQEYENTLTKENAAWHSFDYLLTSRNRQSNKQELCQKAVIFIYKCQINAELNYLLGQIILKTTQQLETHLDILEQTNNLLSELKQQLEEQYSPETIWTPSFEQIKEKIPIEELRRDFETIIGHPLNQWGVSSSISNVEIARSLTEKLKPIAREIYADLRKEALDISFLEYAESSSYKPATQAETLVDYWKT